MTPLRTPLSSKLFLASLLAGILGASAASVAQDFPPQPSSPVAYHEAAAFQFFVPAGGVPPAVRARQASAALTAALDTEEPAYDGAPEAEVTLDGEGALVRVRGHLVTVLYVDDALAAGFPSLEHYAEHLSTRLGEYVPAQRRRGNLQRTALHIFLSVFIGLLTVVALRQIQAAFVRADEALEGRKDALGPLTVLRVPILGGEALGGALAFLVDIGRVLAMVGTVVAAGVAILGQFDSTRPWLARAGATGVGAVLAAIQSVGGALPTVVLAGALAVGMHASLRVVRVLLEGVQSRRIAWSFLPPRRVPVFRAMVTTAVLLVGSPLVAAAAFGRFGTPLETLALMAGAVVALGMVPVLANWAAGGVLMWRQSVNEGDWVQVGRHAGEVTAIHFTGITVVPKEGGTVVVPHLRLLVSPLQRMMGPPLLHVAVCVARQGALPAQLETLAQVLRAVDPGVVVNVVDVTGARLVLDIAVAAFTPGNQQAVWVALANAADQGTVTLLPATPVAHA